MSRWTRIATAATVAAVGLALAAPAAALAATSTPPAGSTTSTKVTGVDVSSWQHPGGASINWAKVAAAGQSFAIIKATEGTSYKNPYYAADTAAARAAGLVVGAYHFASPALPLSTAVAQADYFVATTGKMRTAKTLPPILDIESSDGLSVANRVAWVKSFLSRVRTLTGRTPMIYSYDSYLRNQLGGESALAAYPLWYAMYSSTPPGSLPGGWNTWTLWQYTSVGSVAGISGQNDINQFNGTKASLLALADGTKAAPLAPGAPTALKETSTWPDAKIAWTPPASDGGSPITNYVVSIDGGADGSTPSAAYVAGPLAAGDHTASVRAVTVAGTGPATTLSFTLTKPVSGSGTPHPAASKLALATPTTVARGSAGTTTVTLRRSDTGQPVGSQVVKVTVTPLAGSAQVVSLRTNASGVAGTKLALLVNSTVTASFGGTAELVAAKASSAVKVLPAPTVRLAATTVRHGSATTLSGSVSALYKGGPVVRQIYLRGAWRNSAGTTVSASGSYSFAVRISAPGTYQLRIVVYATRLHLAGTSAVVRLRVT